MASIERVMVAPAVLEWARRTAGFDVRSAAARLHVPEARLEAWENGSVKPTVTQLRSLASLYKRPLVVLLLPIPPKDFDALHDFRRKGAEPEGKAQWSPALHAEFKRAISQREVLLELSEVAPGVVERQTHRFSFAISEPAEGAGQQLRDLLGMNEWKAATWADPRIALRNAIEAAERLGVLVLQSRDVTIGEMRGFSISNWPYPVVVLNGSDWPRPRLFTLLHELCHLGLNSGGLCDLHEQRSGERRTEDHVEHYCNNVGAAALMPWPLLLRDADIAGAQQDHEWTLDELTTLGRRYGASSEAVLLRLVGLNLATWSLYWVRKAQLEAAYTEARQLEKERQQQSDGGPSYYTVKARNLGYRYVQSVIEAFQTHAISSLDVANYLDIRFDQLTKLEAAALR